MEPPQTVGVALAEIIGDLNRLSRLDPECTTEDMRTELERFGSCFGSAIADAARAGDIRLVGQPGRNFAAALAQLSRAFKKAGLLPEVDQIPRDSTPDRCWADVTGDGRGDHSCVSDAETAIGLCFLHADQLRSSW